VEAGGALLLWGTANISLQNVNMRQNTVYNVRSLSNAHKLHNYIPGRKDGLEGHGMTRLT
jgi:hypothetical protein